MANLQTALSLVLIVSLLIQAVPIAAQVLAYQFFNSIDATDTYNGYYIFIIVASSLSCIFYFILIPMSFNQASIMKTGFRMLLLLVIILQFAIATVLSVYIRNN